MGSKPSKILINKKVIEPIEMDKGHSSNVSSTTKDDSLREISSNKEQKFQVLCLHGKRTSGHILSFQTSAMRHHTKMNAVFLDAPYRATGEPDPGVLMFYPNLDYYEWYTSNDYSNVKVGIDKIMQMLDSQSFDAILGFSQGAQMATIIATLLERKNTNDKIKGIICIGGVAPRLQHLEPESRGKVINISSLHIIGEKDPYKSYSQLLIDMYAPETRTVLYHPEDHRIPSMSTNIYPNILEWLKKYCS